MESRQNTHVLWLLAVTNVSTQSTGSDITSNLEIGQSVQRIVVEAFTL